MGHISPHRRTVSTHDTRRNPTDDPEPSSQPSNEVTRGDVEQVERALIDASTRVPVLMFYTSAIVWLLLGTLLAGFTSFKLHMPDLLAGCSFLTWGRLRPAHMNVMLYGWASMAGIGTVDLADGAALPHDLAASVAARGGRGFLESRRASRCGRNSCRRQHRL